MLFFSFVSMGYFRIYISKWNGSDRIYRVRLTQLLLNLIVSLVFILCFRLWYLILYTVSCDFRFICISFCFVRVLNLQYVSLFRIDFLLCEFVFVFECYQFEWIVIELSMTKPVRETKTTFSTSRWMCQRSCACNGLQRFFSFCFEGKKNCR